MILASIVAQKAADITSAVMGTATAAAATGVVLLDDNEDAAPQETAQVIAETEQEPPSDTGVAVPANPDSESNRR